MNQNFQDSAKSRACRIASRVQSRALQHILEVLYLSWFEGFSRAEAQLEIAKRHGVTNGTVMDAFSERRGGVSQSELDRFIEKPDLKGLEQALLKRFKDDPQAASPIREFMLEIRRSERSPSLKAFLMSLSPEELLSFVEKLKLAQPRKSNYSD